MVRELTPAGEPLAPLLNPVRVVTRLWHQRQLIWRLTQRDLAGRYRGSSLGMLWSLIAPLLMLGVYTFAFSIVFKARWGLPNEGKGLFALVLFTGLIPFNVFSEVAGEAPGIIIGNPSYVKRVVFPLELLPLVKFLSAVTHGLISALVLVAGLLVERGTVPPTILLMPLAWVPQLLLTLGVAYGLAAFGVFVRDTAHVVGIALSALFFLTPIIYPMEAVPPPLRPLIALNPMAYVVEAARDTAIHGTPLVWTQWLKVSVATAPMTMAGFLLFMRSKTAFSDAL